MTIISKSCFRQNTCLTKLLILRSLTWWIQELSRTCGMIFEDFSSTCLVFKYFQGLVWNKKIQGLSRISRMRGNPEFDPTPWPQTKTVPSIMTFRVPTSTKSHLSCWSFHSRKMWYSSCWLHTANWQHEPSLHRPLIPVCNVRYLCT